MKVSADQDTIFDLTLMWLEYIEIRCVFANRVVAQQLKNAQEDRRVDAVAMLQSLLLGERETTRAEWFQKINARIAVLNKEMSWRRTYPNKMPSFDALLEVVCVKSFPETDAGIDEMQEACLMLRLVCNELKDEINRAVRHAKEQHVDPLSRELQ